MIYPLSQKILILSTIAILGLGSQGYAQTKPGPPEAGYMKINFTGFFDYAFELEYEYFAKENLSIVASPKFIAYEYSYYGGLEKWLGYGFQGQLRKYLLNVRTDAKRNVYFGGLYTAMFAEYFDVGVKIRDNDRYLYNQQTGTYENISTREKWDYTGFSMGSLIGGQVSFRNLVILEFNFGGLLRFTDKNQNLVVLDENAGEFTWRTYEPYSSFEYGTGVYPTANFTLGFNLD